MKRFLLFVIFLIFAVWLGLLLKQDPGYLLIGFHKTTIELPLWLAIVILIIVFLVLHWLVRFINYGCGVPGRFRFWSNRRKNRSAQTQTNRGLIALAEGNWPNAEKHLLRSVAIADTPLINYLAAARAAQQQGAYERRDNYLRQAHRANPEAEIAVGLTQAQLQLDHQQLEQALATLCHLRELVPNHKYVLKLLKLVYLELNDWKNLLKLLPQLKRHKVCNPEEIATLELLIYRQLLSNKQDKQAIQKLWHDIPKHLHAHPELVAIYANFLIQHNEAASAETLLRDSLKKNWNEQLVTLYGKIQSPEPKKQLATAESWLKQHKNDATLLLALGRICITNSLWGKARSYLENSIELNPTPEAYQELTSLLEKLGERDKAIDYYREAISHEGSDLTA